METAVRILEQFTNNHPAVAAAETEKLTDQQILEFFQTIPAELRARILAYMDRFRASFILKDADAATSVSLMQTMPESTLLDLLRILATPDKEELLNRLPNEHQQRFRQILNHSDDTVGAYVEPGVFTLYQHQQVSECIAQVKNHDQAIGSHIVVINTERKLVGNVSLKQLITADPDSKVSASMNQNPPSILADTTVSSTALRTSITQMPFYNIPVVNVEGTFLGVISLDRLTNLVEVERNVPKQALQAGSALGDLYQIGLFSLFRSTGV